MTLITRNMCYHDSKNFTQDDLDNYYGLTTKEKLKWEKYYHENGFDHNLSPVLTTSEVMSLYSWGLIPWFTKSMPDALMIRNKTLNCISEEMFDKPSFRDAIKEGKRCLIPMTGFFEWRWEDSAGKNKTPHYIRLKGQPIFSVAGVYSSWKNKEDDSMIHSYAVLTTKANKLMEEIHNTKKRMPVIIPREYEKDWLNPTLTKEDVLAFCQPFEPSKMEAYPISKRITSKKDPTNVPEVLEKVDNGMLF